MLTLTNTQNEMRPHRHTHVHIPLTLFSAVGSLSLCILELVLPKRGVHKNHLKNLLERRLGFLMSGVEPEILCLRQAPRFGKAKGVLCPSHTIDVVPHIWTPNISERVSQEGLSSLSYHAQYFRERTRDNATIEHVCGLPYTQMGHRLALYASSAPAKAPTRHLLL